MIFNRVRSWTFASVLAAGIVQSTAVIAAAWSMKVLVEVFANGNDGVPLTPLAVLFGLATIAAGCRWYERVAAERLGNSYVHDLRLVMFDALTAQARGEDVPRQEKNRGIHLVRFTSDLNALKQWIALGLGRTISATLFLVGLIVAIALIDPRLAFITAIGLVAAAFTIFALGVGLEKRVRTVRRTRGRLANLVGDSVSHVQTLNAFGRTPKERGRLNERSLSLSSALSDRAFWIGALRACTDFSQRVIVATVLVLGAWFMSSGSLELGAMVASVSVVALIGAPLGDFGRVYEFWKNAVVAREKIGGFLQRTKQRDVPMHILNRSVGHLVINDLTTDWLTIPCTTEIRPGGRVAITGPNGSGKSRLLNTIAGLRSPASGAVLLDSVPTLHLDDRSRSRAIGIASRETALVTGSIGKNVRYRRPGASPSTVNRAVSAAGLSVTDLQAAPDRRIGPLGSGLSDGETSRVKLARAILGEPGMLLLDEIEQGLDLEGREALKHLLGTYPGTILYVSHDEELVGYADTEWRLADGELQITTATTSVDPQEVTA